MDIFEIQTSSLEELSEYCRKIKQLDDMLKIQKENEYHEEIKNQNKPHYPTLETRERMSLSRKLWLKEHGHPLKGIIGKNHHLFGTKWSESRRKKTIKSIKRVHRLHPELFENFYKSRPATIETKMKMSQTRRGKYFCNGVWLDSIELQRKYKHEFNHIREDIRERFNRICMICFDAETDHNMCVHHIDYNMNNNEINNLITLHRECHNKTNLNRIFWFNYFKEIMDILTN